MFFNKKLLQDSVLSVPWHLGTNQKPLKEVELLKICSSLNEWMDVDITKKKHISLRTNAIMVHGTAKLYRDEAKKLWEDCVQLHDKILLRKLPKGFAFEGDSIFNSTSEDEECSPHETQDLSQMTSEHLSRSRNSRRNTIGTISSETKSDEGEMNSQKRRKIEKSRETASKDVSTCTQGLSPETHDIQFSGGLEIQTENSYVISTEERHKYARWNLNENLPMAVVITFGKTVKPENVICSNIVSSKDRL